MPSCKSIGVTCHTTGNDAARLVACNVEKLADLFDECTYALAAIAEMAGIDGGRLSPAELKDLLDDKYQIILA